MKIISRHHIGSWVTPQGSIIRGLSGGVWFVVIIHWMSSEFASQRRVIKCGKSMVVLILINNQKLLNHWIEHEQLQF